jgi:pyruvate,water dikinase
VLIHPEVETLDHDLIHDHLKKLGHGPYAVRSSAVSEDGNSASFAGQFESFLNLQSYEEIRTAIIKCIAAAESNRVKRYAGSLGNDADLRISVILQNMVDARVAGVAFSADPVNNRRDKVIINAIAGTGENLVGGLKDAYHYELFRSGSSIAREAEKNGKLLSPGHLRELLEGTLKAEHRYGKPVDLEWAIDHQDVLHWLQVRPITTLDEVHYNEFDSVRESCQDAWTLGNIGKMMPGVATPLTWSVSAEAIDYGMTLLADRAGAFRIRDRKEPRYIQMFYNRLFINMSHMMDYPKSVWLNKASDVQFALSGLDTT